MLPFDVKLKKKQVVYLGVIHERDQTMVPELVHYYALAYTADKKAVLAERKYSRKHARRCFRTCKYRTEFPSPIIANRDDVLLDLDGITTPIACSLEAAINHVYAYMYTAIRLACNLRTQKSYAVAIDELKRAQRARRFLNRYDEPVAHYAFAIELALAGLAKLLDPENSRIELYCDSIIHWHGIDTTKEYIAAVDSLSPMFREFYNTFYGDKVDANE